MLELTGYVGAALLLFAYAMISFHKWKARSVSYQVVNIAAAVLLVVYGAYKSAYANVLINACWILIGTVGLLLIGKRKKPTRKSASFRGARERT